MRACGSAVPGNRSFLYLSVFLDRKAFIPGRDVDFNAGVVRLEAFVCHTKEALRLLEFDSILLCRRLSSCCYRDRYHILLRISASLLVSSYNSSLLGSLNGAGGMATAGSNSASGNRLTFHGPFEYPSYQLTGLPCKGEVADVKKIDFGTSGVRKNSS